eukprot:4522830-Pleurochrysis_carterae.AAC.3
MCAPREHPRPGRARLANSYQPPQNKENPRFERIAIKKLALVDAADNSIGKERLCPISQSFSSRRH